MHAYAVVFNCCIGIVQGLVIILELHAVKPSSLSELRAKSASPACIKKYFDELGKILKKYDQVNNLCSCQAIPNLCHSFHMFHKKRFFFLTV
jgi:hypothetical protein